MAFAVFIAAMWTNAAKERRMRLQSVEGHLLDTARLIAAQHKEVIEYGQQYLKFLVREQSGSRTLLAKDCDSILAHRLQEETRIANIYLALPDGKVVCSARPSARSASIFDRAAFRKALASSEVVIGAPTRSQMNGEEGIPFFKSVDDINGNPIGVYAVTLNLSALVKDIAAGNYPDGARIGLVNSSGLVLARQPDPDNWLGRDASGTSFFKTVAARNSEGTFEEFGFDGVPRVYGLARFADTSDGPIWLWVGYAKDAVTADIERDFERSVIATLGLMMLAFAAIWGGGERLLLRPIAALAAAARRMGEGDLTARTGLERRRDELGWLAKSFDDMAHALQEKEQHIVLASRALKVLSRWNEALLVPRDEASLAKCMCQSIVDFGGYRSAWVGYARADENKSVEPIATCGMDPEFVAGMKVSWADTARGRGPTGLAIRQGSVEVLHDYMTNAATAPWRENALRGRLNSIISIPLRVDGAVIGALSIHSAEAESFGEQESALLTELAAALASAISAVRASAERAQLEVSLRSSEDRFRAAAEASLDALLLLRSVRDAAGNIVDFEVADMNSRAARQFDVKKDAVVGKTFFQLLKVHRGARFFARFAQVVVSRQPLEEEFQFHVPGSETRWYRQQVVAVDDGVAVSLRDITVWKTAGDRIREAEERLRLAMAGARMGAWNQVLPGDIYAISEDIGPIFGLPKGAGPRSREALMNAVHPDDRERLAKGMKRDLETRKPGTIEFRVIWPDGTLHWVEAHNNVICDNAGTPQRSVGVLTDITQRKHDVAALERANRALKTLSAGNEALVHAKDETELLQAVCRAIVEQGRYQMASVGYPQDDPEKTIAPKAWAGIESGYITSVKHTWADTEAGQRPIAKAIRSGKAELARDIRDKLAFAPVKELVAEAGYASNLALPLCDANKVIGALSIYASDADAFDEAEVRLLQELADDLAYGIVTLRTKEERDRIAHAHEHHEAILRKSLEDSIQAIAATVEMRDPYTSGHQKRVADLATAIAREMGLAEERIHGLHLAGIVHDVGKISVPSEILAKPGKLTQIEKTLIQVHAEAGYAILKDIEFPWPIATIVRQHHERLDGSGYPQGLKADEILLESKILAVADVVEAMGSHRPYRPTLGIEVALQEIERGKGLQYDPDVADACVKLFRDGHYALEA